MIYYLGDSFFFGWNFIRFSIPNRKESIFSHLLSEKLGCEYKNLSIPGSSNYRLCRLVNFLDIKKDDIVILGWSACERIELGIPKDTLLPNDFVVDYNNIDSLDSHSWIKIMQLVEKTGNIYTRQIYPTMMRNLDRVTSPNTRKATELFYHYASDIAYHQQMFKILFNSAVHRLRTIGCKFLMTTTWDVEFEDREFLNIPEYLFYKSNFAEQVRGKGDNINERDLPYFSIKEHEIAADILYQYLK